ncbi:MAG: HAD-IA family hydrolase [Pirellulales bacterium]
MFPNVKAVVFDAVGTLIRPHRPVAEIYHEVGRRHGFEFSQATIADRFPLAFQRQESIDADAGNWETDEQRERERWRAIVGDVFEVVDACGIVCGDFEKLFADLWDHFSLADHWRVYDDVGPTLGQLARRRFILGVASNLDSRLECLAKQLHSLETCQHWFISSQVGYRKPGNEFFQRAEQCLGVSADRILMIGDDPRNDVEGARQRGWHAMLVNRQLSCSSTGAIHKLTELLALLPE